MKQLKHRTFDLESGLYVSSSRYLKVTSGGHWRSNYFVPARLWALITAPRSEHGLDQISWRS